ncbi:MAG: hypothetical protein VKL60_17695 [Sphaerospermopsis sp.]|nr:hypothetical protein [Sphaerospermopsis sp.]
MKKILTFLFVFIASIANYHLLAQSTASPDTVCIGSVHVYDVNPTAGSTYIWSLQKGSNFGTITPLAGRTDSISISYSTSTGTDTLMLVEIGPTGCFSDTVKLALVKLPAITVVLSGTDSICINNASSARLSLTFTGTPPFNVTYTDGTTPATISTSANPHLITSPVYTTTGVFPYSIISAFGLGSCPAISSGSGSIRVFPRPNPGAINHY